MSNSVMRPRGEPDAGILLASIPARNWPVTCCLSASTKECSFREEESAASRVHPGEATWVRLRVVYTSSCEARNAVITLAYKGPHRVPGPRRPCHRRIKGRTLLRSLGDSTATLAGENYHECCGPVTCPIAARTTQMPLASSATLARGILEVRWRLGPSHRPSARP